MTLRRIIVFILLLVIPAGLVSAQTPPPPPTQTPTWTPAPTIPSTGLIPVGSIMAFGRIEPPNDAWLACDGHAVYRSEFSVLFSVIGTTFGSGDGSTTFNLPDCRGRTLVGIGAGLGGLTNRTIGSWFGSETHTLTITELPPHNHTERVQPNSGASTNRVLAQSAQGAVQDSALTTGTTGGGAAFNIMQPSMGVGYFVYAGGDSLNPEIEITVVVVFPSHTPTPTNTPTLTPTNGPSPTHTATPTATPLGEIGYQVGDQTVLILNQVTPGDLVIVGFLVVVSGLLITILFFLIRRRS